MYIIYTSGEIDDEKHFLISCSTCPEIRTEMFGRINNISVKIFMSSIQNRNYIGFLIIKMRKF
jgi:hypothetical protein